MPKCALHSIFWIYGARCARKFLCGGSLPPPRPARVYEGKMMNGRELAIEAVALAYISLWTRAGELVLESPHVTGRDAIGACKVMKASAGQWESVRR